MPIFSKPHAFFRCLRAPRLWGSLLARSNETAAQKPRISRVVKNRSSFSEGGYILLIIPGAAFALGTWQVRRREWKLNLIKDMERRTTDPPVELPVDLGELPELEYRRVKVRGHFDHSREISVGPRSNVLQAESGGSSLHSSSQSGSYIITPFILSDKDMTILVNRGWVPTKSVKPHTRKEGQITGEIELVGTVRMNEKRSPFMPKDTAEKGYWMYRDIDKMAEFLNTAPVFLDADQSSSVPGGPIGGQTRVQLRNEHLTYIFTWYTLAILTFMMWFRRYRRPPPPDSALEYFRKSM